MIQFCGENAITFEVGGVATTIQLQQSLHRYEANPEAGALELLLWGVIAAYREQTKQIQKSIDDARAAAPDVKNLVDDVIAKLPAIVNELGGGSGPVTGTSRIFPTPREQNGGKLEEGG